MKILFDQGVPVPLRRFLHPHSVDTASERGWEQLRNGASGFPGGFYTDDMTLWASLGERLWRIDDDRDNDRDYDWIRR